MAESTSRQESFTVTVYRESNGAVIIEQHPARIVISDTGEVQRVAHAILDYALDAGDWPEAQEGGAT